MKMLIANIRKVICKGSGVNQKPITGQGNNSKYRLSILSC